jgi:hypothetical protein
MNGTHSSNYQNASQNIPTVESPNSTVEDTVERTAYRAQFLANPTNENSRILRSTNSIHPRNRTQANTIPVQPREPTNTGSVSTTLTCIAKNTWYLAQGMYASSNTRTCGFVLRTWYSYWYLVFGSFVFN